MEIGQAIASRQSYFEGTFYVTSVFRIIIVLEDKPFRVQSIG